MAGGSRMSLSHWRSAVLADWRTLDAAPKELRADREVMLSVVKQKGKLISVAQGPLVADRELALVALTQDPSAYHCMSPELQADSVLVLEAVKKNDGIILEQVPQRFRDSRDFMLQAVANNWMALRYAPESLCSDREIALRAVLQCVRALANVSEELKADEDFMLEAASANWRSLECGSEEVRGNRQVVIAAVSQDVRALEFASEGFRSDSALMLEAASVRSDALKYVSEPCFSDLGFWMRIIKELPEGWHLAERYGPPSLSSDRPLVVEAIKRDWQALRWASEKLRDDPELVRMASTQSWKATLVPKRVSVGTMVQAVQQDWRAIERFLANGWVDDVLASLVQANPAIIQSRMLKSNKAAVLLAVACDGLSLRFGSPELRGDRQVVLQAVDQNWRALQFASARLRGDRRVAQCAFKQSGLALQHCSEDIRSDGSLVVEAMSNNISSFQFATDKLHADNSFWEVLVRRFDTGWKKWLRHGRGRESPGFMTDEELELPRQLAKSASLTWKKRDHWQARGHDIVSFLGHGFR